MLGPFTFRFLTRSSYRRLVALPVLLVALTVATATNAKADEVLVPFIDGEWTQIAGNPDLGELTGDRQQPVDFAVWQAADGTWQALSCVRRTKIGGNTRLLHRWEGKNITDPDWKEMGVSMTADPSVGEIAGGIQAPHVVKEGDTYHMCYGDWVNICHATSKDGKNFERVIQPDGTTAAFSEGPGNNTRDVVLIKVGDTWYGYYTAYPNRQGTVYVRTTKDFNTWSESTAVALGGEAGADPYAAECPHVIYRHGYFYLFRTQDYGPKNITRIYRSKDPYRFGANEDDKYLVGSLPVAAPEIVRHDGQDYIVALNLNLDGLRVAKLGFKPPAKVGEPVLKLDDEASRDAWQVESGDIETALTQTTRDEFNAPQSYFVGTAELADGKYDDDRKGVVRSPKFTVEDEEYYAYLAGGVDSKKLYVALHDAETDEELARLSPNLESNAMKPVPFRTHRARGRTVYLKIVDQATDSWGHINFGGLHKVE